MLYITRFIFEKLKIKKFNVNESYFVIFMYVYYFNIFHNIPSFYGQNWLYGNVRKNSTEQMLYITSNFFKYNFNVNESYFVILCMLSMSIFDIISHLFLDKMDSMVITSSHNSGNWGILIFHVNSQIAIPENSNLWN